MATIATCPHSQGYLHNQHQWDLFFKVKKKNLHMEGQTKGVHGGEFFSFEKKRTHECCGKLPWLLVPRW
jgi:hypothetical protein